MPALVSPYQDEVQRSPGPYGIRIVRVRTGATLQLAVSGEIDITTAPLLRQKIEQAKDHDLDLIVLDLQQVTFIDSTGLRALLEAQEQLNGRLRIMPSPPVSRLIEITKVRDRLTLLSSATAQLSLTPPASASAIAARKDLAPGAANGSAPRRNGLRHLADG